MCSRLCFGACLLATWGLPSVVMDAVEDHHEPLVQTEKYCEVTEAVKVAQIIAHALDEHSKRVQDIPIDESWLQSLGIGTRFRVRALSAIEAAREHLGK